MSKALLKLAAVVGLGSIIAGCGPRQTVDWYTAHPSERGEKVTWCLADAGRQADADCLNAIKSRDLARFAPSAPATDFVPKVVDAPGASASSPAASGDASAPSARHLGATGAKPTEFHYKKPASVGGN